ARALGCRTLPGGGMAVYPAVDAVELCSGRAPDAERMFEQFRALVAR
ncbi:shikimate dehydrogenase, partial [Burkholderia pseudomallei]